MNKKKKSKKTKKRTLWIYLFLLSGLMVMGFNGISYASYEYMIIVHDSLDGSALQQFINHKQGMDFNIDKRVISDGTSNSQIKNLIQQAFYQGSSMPQFLLLVGSAAFDTLNGDSLADASKGNFIPTHYAIDFYGRRTAFDQWYVEVDTLKRGPPTPDIHIGRLPATNEAELQAFVDKVIYYENDNSSDSWKWNTLFLAGDVNRGPFPDFPSPYMVNLVTDELMNDYTPYYMVKNALHASDFSTAQEKKDTTVKLIDEGQLIINALGTGADRGNLVYFLYRFGSGADFDCEDELSNFQKYPFVIGASCHLAQFDTCVVDTFNNPISTMSQNLLFSDDAGAIALLGGSGATSELGNFDLNRNVFSNIFEKDIINLGRLTTATKVFATDNGGGAHTYRMYTLLGDPSMNLGLITTHFKPFSRTGFEVTDPVCYQNYVVDYQDVFGRVGKSELDNEPPYFDGYLRCFKVEGYDDSDDHSHCYWKLYDFDNLNVPIDSVHRFLSFHLKVEESPNDLGHISLDAHTSDGLNLRDDPSIVDQYGERIHPSYHRSPEGWWKFYAFDLASLDGKFIDELLVGYDDGLIGETGHFLAFIDEIRFSADWGSAPFVDTICMPHPIFVENDYAVSVDAHDYDETVFGDQLTFEWLLSGGQGCGSISGSGSDVIYHAPDLANDGIIITVKVSDRGGHEETRSHTFDVQNPDPGGGCPFVYVWNGQVFVNDNVILTASEDEYNNRSNIIDYCVLSQAPVPKDNHYELEIREFEKEISYLDHLSLIAVDYPERENIGITPEGKIWTYYKSLLPISCVDQDGVDHLDKIIKKDRKYFVSKKPGYLIINFGELSRVNFYKPVISLGGGGGTGIPPGDKTPNKLAAFHPVQTRGNIVYVDVLRRDGEWQNVAKVYPRTGKVRTLVELAQYADPDEDFLIKIGWEKSYAVNRIAYYCFEDHNISINRLSLGSALHTKNGEVKSLLSGKDDQSVTLSPNESLRLLFPALPEDPSKKRGFILAAKGYYETIGAVSPRPTYPHSLEMEQNYPNPFNQNTQIKFSLPEATSVTLDIYNILGQKVVTLMDGERPRGTHTITWDGRDRSGSEIASGIYFYKIKAGDFQEQKKMLLIK